MIIPKISRESFSFLLRLKTGYYFMASLSEAIQQAQWMDIDRLEVRTDSMYVFNCMTKWVYQG